MWIDDGEVNSDMQERDCHEARRVICTCKLSKASEWISEKSGSFLP